MQKIFGTAIKYIRSLLERCRGFVNFMFYLTFALYSCLAFYKTTMFVYIVTDRTNRLVSYAMVGILALACAEFAAEWVLSDDLRYKWMTAAIFLAIFLQLLFGHALSSVVSFVFALAASGKSLKKILWIYFIFGLLGMILAYQASMRGIIEYLTYANDTKHAFGIQYSTDCAAHILYLMTAYCILKSCYHWRLASLDILLLGIGAMFNYRYIGARSNFVCMLLLLLLTLLYDFGALDFIEKGSKQAECPALQQTEGEEQRFRTGTLSKSRGFSAILGRLVYFSGLVSYPFLLLFCMLAAFFYREEMTASWSKALGSVRSRLSMSHAAMQQYPVFTLWGNAISERGAGGVVDQQVPYFFLDCSYIRFPMLVGWVMTAAFLMLMLCIVRRAYKTGNTYLILILIVIAISGIIEHHLCEFSYNFLPMLAFCVEDTIGRGQGREDRIGYDPALKLQKGKD